ncbi:MAG: hypothetical protein ACXVX9_07935 [Mycobacteriaceae bacterium]
MPTSKRDARFLWRMAGLVLIGCALLILGALLNPPRGLLHALHKEI